MTKPSYTSPPPPTMGKITSASDWSMEYLLYDKATNYEEAKGGLVLKNLFHDDYSFARDCRVLGIWLFPVDAATHKPEFLILGPPDFKINSFKQYNANEGETVERAPYNFNAYNTYLQLEVEHESVSELFGISEPFKVIQKYLFTDYNDNPAHEPAGEGFGYVYGALFASRFFPMVTLQLPEQYQGLIKSFRVDYYFHPKIDGFTKKAKNLRDCSKDYPSGINDFPNQAGVFLDGVNPFTVDPMNIASEYTKDIKFVPSQSSLLTTLLSPLLAPLTKLQNPDFATAVFTGTEKPLVLEICTTGVQDSSIKFIKNGKEGYGWDNIHWWGSRGTGNPIISAIGAFHCFHLHWRWNEPAQFLGGNHFEGVSNYFDGPLVDPNLENQTVRFSVCKYSSARDPELVNLKNLSKETFSDLFHKNNNPAPQEINLPDNAGFEGANLVLWFSVEASIPDDFKEGTVFIHGIFFAHDNEPQFHPFTGSMTEEYIPKSKDSILQDRQWDR